MPRPNKNTYEFNGDVCVIYTANKQAIYVDACDFYKYELHKHSWMITSRGYVATSIKGNRVYLHRLLMNPNTLQVDHINHNKLDNRKSNLRIVTNKENHHNKPPNKLNTSGCSGVHWNKQCKKWCTQLRTNGVCVSSTLHESLEEAIAKRKELERIYWNVV